MAYNLRLTKGAKNDFRSMFNYYLGETQDIKYTEQIIQGIRGNVELLKTFPYRYTAPNPDDQSIRVMYLKRYAVLYEVSEDAVIILSVKHTSINSEQ